MSQRWSCLCAAAAAVCLWVPVTGSGKTVELYVATDGRDTNPATREAPLQSLEAARDAVRRLNTSEASDGGITVWVRGGVYPRANTLELTAEDSGTEKAPVAYRAYPNEQMRLVGGREIPPGVVKEDPGFVDAANMNFQLRDDSIVYKQIPGFQKIPFADIGPYPDEYRATWPIDRRGSER